MKFSVVVRYSSGAVMGFTVKVSSRKEAWEKIANGMDMSHVQSIEVVEMLADKCEIK